jgi:homoserine dehydrogenase
MTIVDDCISDQRAPAGAAAADSPATIRVGLFGLGHVGSAVARLAGAIGPWRIETTAALVRDPSRPRDAQAIAVTTDPADIFRARPDVIVEALGGIEPARRLVLDALKRGIPVVTANKSLLAHHGEELADAAARAGVAFRYEASVIAGVPFLSTFAGRPHASRVTSIAGIVNGTTNFILSAMDGGQSGYALALADAQRRGYAEPDPSNDVRGIDAAEKLAILVRQFYGRHVDPLAIETTGMEDLTPLDFAHARALGGTLKPVVVAEPVSVDASAIAAFAGPAFVPVEHPLARVRQANNGLCIRDVAGSDLCFTGPGAGPDVTAVTILDDVIEAAARRRFDVIDAAAGRRGAPVFSVSDTTAASPTTPWLVRLAHDGSLRAPGDVLAVLAAHGVTASRTSIRSADRGQWSHAILTHPCTRPRVEAAAAAAAALTGSTAGVYRALESPGRHG